MRANSTNDYFCEMDIPILYQDDALVVVSKPNNILVHPSYYARNIKEPSLIELLSEVIDEKLYPVHRLDYKTSGVMILAKSSVNAAALQKQFEENTIQKVYYALVRGYSDKKGKVDTPVKNPDTGKYKEALTNYSTLESVEVAIAVQPYSMSRYSLVVLFPKTGRMHQLRKHMNKISHPIIGDHKYGNRHHNRMFEEELKYPNMFLHAYQISFRHPVTKEEVCINVTPPEFWLNAFKRLSINPTCISEQVVFDNNQNHLG